MNLRYSSSPSTGFRYLGIEVDRQAFWAACRSQAYAANILAGLCQGRPVDPRILPQFGIRIRLGHTLEEVRDVWAPEPNDDFPPDPLPW